MVVGLDPDPGRIPQHLFEGPPEDPTRLCGGVYAFCRGILEAVAGEVAAVKPQAAYFERLGPAGLQVYANLLRDAADLGLPTIADVKRGDIGRTAEAYAEAHLRTFGATAVTVNPYMGSDAVRPFLDEARSLGRGGGAFVLVATSNPGAQEEVQGHGDPPLTERVAALVADLGASYPSEPGSGGYPAAGAVVGVTRPEVGRRIRGLLPDALFLAPGYGAQGGGARDVLPLLNGSGGGVLVNSSREILYAHEKNGAPEGGSGVGDYRVAARATARRMREQLLAAGVRPG